MYYPRITLFFVFNCAVSKCCIEQVFERCLGEVVDETECFVVVVMVGGRKEETVIRR